MENTNPLLSNLTINEVSGAVLRETQVNKVRMNSAFECGL